MINCIETRRLVYEVAPDIKLWRWIGSNDFELVFNLGAGHNTSYQSNDAGYFADLLVVNGHSKDHCTALKKISKGGLS